MKNVIDNAQETCIGCNACVQVCPNSCIKMELNFEGFWYPVINEALCNDCQICKNVCPTAEGTFAPEMKTPNVYGAWNLDDGIRANSTSGGVFSALANLVIQKGGVVFGAAFNQEMQVNHVMVDNIEDLIYLQGSKYVQSKIENTYIMAKKQLKSGRQVLFTGTPCQIAGLYSFLRTDYDNLITCDLVCHGVNSPKIFAEYINGLEKKNKAKVISYKFRDKSRGWKNSTLAIEFSNSFKYYVDIMKDSFGYGFLKNVCLRPSCHNCKFSKIPRIADITIADFWGVANYYPDLDDDKGTSLVMINSNKGKKVFDLCSDMLFIKEVELEKAIEYNNNAIGSEKPSPKREQFFLDYSNKGYKYVAKRYLTTEPSRVRKFKRMIKKIRAIIFKK